MVAKVEKSQNMKLVRKNYYKLNIDEKSSNIFTKATNLLFTTEEKILESSFGLSQL